MAMRMGGNRKPTCKNTSDCCDFSHCGHIDCSKILCEVHKLIKESEKCFESAEEIQNEVLCTLLQCLLDLEESMEKYHKGKKFVVKGERLLDCSPCCFDCNRDSCKCRELKREATKAYSYYEKEMIEVICMLKKLIVSLKYTLKSSCEATRIYEKYLDCVHCCKDKCDKK
ncbi:MAG: hypothetical protein RR782_07745 [Clostridium sp.]